MKLIIRKKGGTGSGFEGHAGRPGKVGGSAPKGGANGGKKSNWYQSERGVWSWGGEGKPPVISTDQISRIKSRLQRSSMKSSISKMIRNNLFPLDDYNSVRSFNRNIHRIRKMLKDNQASGKSTISYDELQKGIDFLDDMYDAYGGDDKEG